MCANACPYTTRYFNFFNPQWDKPLHLQFNPDVSVREVGVMEKCTFCIQRIKAVEQTVPAAYRDPEGHWAAVGMRARIIYASKDRVKQNTITYEELADPKWKGAICVRSSTHPYMLSLVASMVAHLGEPKAEAWVKGLTANLARAPKGGDTDQIKAAFTAIFQEVQSVNSVFASTTLPVSVNWVPSP